MTAAIVQLPKSQIQQINGAVDHYNTLVMFVKRSLRNELDYGKIPGCGEKPVLFKPGAEKIATLFGLRESIERLEAVKDWTGKDFGGEPFFSFEYKVTLRDRSGDVIAECIGSCNSWEQKYRYRKAERTCPHCGASAIIKGKEEYGGGWLCFKRKGGCGAKFGDGDTLIESQQVGDIPNERVFDQVNTIDKMAQKRAFVGAVILAANASNFFAVEHSEIDTIDADWEPAEGISEAIELQRVNVEVIDDIDQGQVNRDRIRFFIQRTGHSLHDVKQLAGCTADDLDDVGMRGLIDKLLIDLGQTKHVTSAISRQLLGEIRREQPHITDDNLLNRFIARCGEALTEQVPSRPQPSYVGAVSIS